MKVVGVPRYHHIMPLVVIQRLVRTTLDKVGTVAQVKYVVQIPKKQGAKQNQVEIS